MLPTQTKGDEIREGLAALNDVPIAFFGKLEDQYGKPVVGAEIAGSIRIYNGVESTNQRLATVSDASGLFQLKGEHGESLSMMPRKQGYVLASGGTEFKYSALYDGHQNPDPNNPVVIKMWKLKGAEPLVGIGKEYTLPFTGKPLFFDLLTGGVSDSGGDLKIVVTRTQGPFSKRNPGDWSIEVSPVNGGIMESDSATYRVTYEAPAEGYQSGDLVQMNHDNLAWFDNVQKVFFLSSRGGQVYSKFYLNFGINDDPNEPLWFQFKGVANANGSRNWEGAPDTMAAAR
jgi:hypothetical protein